MKKLGIVLICAICAVCFSLALILPVIAADGWDVSGGVASGSSQFTPGGFTIEAEQEKDLIGYRFSVFSMTQLLSATQTGTGDQLGYGIDVFMVSNYAILKRGMTKPFRNKVQVINPTAGALRANEFLNTDYRQILTTRNPADEMYTWISKEGVQQQILLYCGVTEVPTADGTYELNYFSRTGY